MRISIDHRLSFTPPAGTGQAVFHLLLTPRSGPTQTVESWSVEGPGIGNAGRFTDGFGNAAHLVNQIRPEGEIVFHVRGEVETRDSHGVLGRLAGEPVPALYRRSTELTKVPAAFKGDFTNTGGTRLDLLHALMAEVGAALGMPDQAPTQMQADGGQAQTSAEEPEERPMPADYAHLFIGAARSLEIPARYVVGYRLTDDGEGALHAWAEAFDEGLGWIGFDPHQQLCPTERYVRLAVGLDADTAPTLRAVPAGEPEQSVAVSAIVPAADHD
jgi:transglutaminase-like putative cysteine protease